MALKDALLPEFDHEMASTRRTLERVPEDKLDWKPHPKSMALGGLATHLAQIPSWVVQTIELDELDVAPPEKGQLRAELKRSRKELLAAFDAHVAAARAALAGATDERLRGPWTLLAGGRKVFTLPRMGALRGFILNHSIHHRAQLGLYLRMNDVPVPAIYGPSADEGSL